MTNLKKSKILILSSDSDQSTNLVMDWIHYNDAEVVRLNGDDFFNDRFSFRHSLDNVRSSVSIKAHNQVINGNDITAVWLRKDSEPDFDSSVGDLDDDFLKAQVIKYIKREYKYAKNSFYDFFGKIKNIGASTLEYPSKMKMLTEAKRLGIIIPETLITNKKEDVITFLNKHESIVSKPILDVTHFSKLELGRQILKGIIYTEAITQSNLLKISESFFPSLFQNKIEKIFEIRTFYLNEKCYSMAIFSQLDNQTSVDFRMYNKEKHNRCVPYNLPQNLECKIVVLMNSLGFNSGSLDFIKSASGEFVFLEVNPWGQYGMVSEPCNYYLDEKIANFLC